MLLWHVVHDQRKSTMTLKTEVISNQTKCDFLHEISVVCWSLLTLCEHCGSYSNMENDIVKQLCIHCVRCANAMLDYQHEQGKWLACTMWIISITSTLHHWIKLEVVEKELFKDDDAFEPLLSRLRNCSCSSPNIDPWPGPMIDFYRKRHIYSKCKYAIIIIIITERSTFQYVLI